MKYLHVNILLSLWLYLFFCCTSKSLGAILIYFDESIGPRCKYSKSLLFLLFLIFVFSLLCPWVLLYYCFISTIKSVPYNGPSRATTVTFLFFNFAFSLISVCFLGCMMTWMPSLDITCLLERPLLFGPRSYGRYYIVV
jgi:hypothetical protein